MIRWRYRCNCSRPCMAHGLMEIVVNQAVHRPTTAFNCSLLKHVFNFLRGSDRLEDSERCAFRSLCRPALLCCNFKYISSLRVANLRASRCDFVARPRHFQTSVDLVRPITRARMTVPVYRRDGTGCLQLGACRCCCMPEPCQHSCMATAAAVVTATTTDPN